MLLMSYTPVSAKLLRLFKCEQIGVQYYLQADTDIVCNIDAKWGTFVLLGGVPGVIVFVVGIPLLFFFLMWRMRNFGVEEMLVKMHRELNNGGRSVVKSKLTTEAKMDVESMGKIWVPPHDSADEDAKLSAYLRRKNMRLERNKSRLGFIYEFYQ
jgi:hypothetical protein